MSVYCKILRGNQVRIPSDPVTVFRESSFICPLHINYVRRERKSMICKPGNLLNIRDGLPCKALISDFDKYTAILVFVSMPAAVKQAFLLGKYVLTIYYGMRIYKNQPLSI